MNKILNRTMFRNQASKEALSTANGHSHRSTGIASGLEYRDGYAVGGRVGYKKGKLVVNEAALDNAMSSFNPNVSIGAGPNLDLPSATTTKDSGIDLDKIMSFSKKQQKELFGTVDPIDYSQFERDFSKYKTDYSGLEPSALGAVGQAAALTIGEPIPEGQNQFATFIANLNKTSGDFKATRQSLDLMAKEDAKKLEEASDAEKQQFAIKKIEAIQNANVANADRLANIYGANLEVALEQEKIRAEAESKKEKTFNIDRTMQIVKQNTQGAPGFSDLPEETQSELVRFAQMDELGNNQMTKSINAFNELYLENFSMDPSNPVLNKPDMERKREGLIQYMTGLYPGYDFELIFPASDLNPGQEKITSAFKSFFPNISDDDMKIIETNIEDKLFDELITVSQRKKDGETTIPNKAGGVVPIDEVLNEYKNQLSIRYPDLNLGD